ncbi:reverse transcriptase domain-containing protein [Tanacetum coccineum]|uniref:Reverse transcriptase domain-containing protein n=1 Tax=Tanacetum coccineum TaxID=301880 RepID=A0ABQ5HJ80_9ASTR
MPPMMTIRSAGRPAAASRGGGTGGRAGRGGGRTRGRSGDQGDGRIDGQDGQVGGQGSEVNDGINGVPDLSTIIAHKLQNLLPTIVAQVGDQGMSWEDFKTLTREEFCPSNEMQKLETELWNHAIIGAGHATYNDRFHKLARLVPHLVIPEGKRIKRYVYGLAPQIQGIVAATKPKTIQKAVQIAGTLIDEALRNGSIKKNHEKRGKGGEPSKDRNVRDDNKRTRTGNAFATITNPLGRENTCTIPKCTICSTYHPSGAPCRTCFNCNRPGHFAKDYRVAPQNAQRPGVNNYNQVVAVNGGQGYRNQGNQERGKAFMLGAEEARQDPNIMTDTFTLNDHYATTLFDSGANYSFVSTTFISLLGIDPIDLGFSYEIEIASRD